MDIEGNEYKALLGAEHLLNEKKIGAIQIEVGGGEYRFKDIFQRFLESAAWGFFGVSYSSGWTLGNTKVWRNIRKFYYG